MPPSPYLVAAWHQPTQAMRQRMRACIVPKNAPLPSPDWFGLRRIQRLRQAHGIAVVQAPNQGLPLADGCWTKQAFVACAVVTADCLPVFLCDEHASRVAALHVGWRGLVAGMLDNVGQRIFNQQTKTAARLYAAFGPAISKKHFEVGPDVYAALTQEDRQGASPSPKPNKWHADLYAIATQRLKRQDVCVGPIPTWCTYGMPSLFYSHRREGGYGRRCGRMINLIWLLPP